MPPLRRWFPALALVGASACQLIGGIGDIEQGAADASGSAPDGVDTGSSHPDGSVKRDARSDVHSSIRDAGGAKPDSTIDSGPSFPDAGSDDAGQDVVDAGTSPDTGVTLVDSGHDAAPIDAGHTPDVYVAPSVDAAPPPAPCVTQVTYGSAWIRPANHPAQFDDASGLVTWDGTCTEDGSNSYALLSNGWQPFFTGKSACVLALDPQGSCASTAPCTTLITYGSTWIHPANHPAQFDEAAGQVIASSGCTASGSDSFELLSNGWQPEFQGTDGCELSFEYTDCGGI